jgi:hypothetical protein
MFIYIKLAVRGVKKLVYNFLSLLLRCNRQYDVENVILRTYIIPKRKNSVIILTLHQIYNGRNYNIVEIIVIIESIADDSSDMANFTGTHCVWDKSFRQAILHWIM